MKNPHPPGRESCSSHQPEGGKYVRHSQGFGDALVMGRYQLNHKKVHMALAAGIKLASGNANATDLYGTRIPDNLQIGSGTVDPVFALFGAYTGMNWIVHGNIFNESQLVPSDLLTMNFSYTLSKE